MNFLLSICSTIVALFIFLELLGKWTDVFSAETFQKELAGLRRNHSKKLTNTGEKNQSSDWPAYSGVTETGRDNQSNVWQKLSHAP